MNGQAGFLDPQHPDVARIQRVRREIQYISERSDRPIDSKQGPIANGLRMFPDFSDPASGWNEEHLGRFQIVTLHNQPVHKMFRHTTSPYACDIDKAVYEAMKMDGMFEPINEDSIVAMGRRINSNKGYTCFYMDLMALMRPSDDEDSDDEGSDDEDSTSPSAISTSGTVEQGTTSLIAATTPTISDTNIVQKIALEIKPLGRNERKSSSLLHSFLSYISGIHLSSLMDTSHRLPFWWIPR
jgi:hypothetical protein